MKIAAALVLALAVASPLAAAQGIINPTITGNDVSFGVSLPLGIGADVSIHFEQVIGLSLANLGLSVSPVNLLDPGLLTRLGGVLSGLSVPGAFPLMLRIEPPSSGGLSFSG